MNQDQATMNNGPGPAIDACGRPRPAPESPVPDRQPDPEASPGALRRLLSDPDPDFEVVDTLVARMGARAAEPMLEALAESESRGVRRQLLARLAELVQRAGAEFGPRIVERLDDDRWFVQRNMLALMGELEAWPPKWSPAPYAESRHAAVRREALKLMLRVDGLRQQALRGLLEDPDPRAKALGLAAAQEDAPPEAIALLLDAAEDESLKPELRSMAIRALTPTAPPEALPVLLSLVTRPGGWIARLFGITRLAPSSLPMRQALAALYRGWRHEPAVTDVLEKAGRSGDPEVRAAAHGMVDR